MIPTLRHTLPLLLALALAAAQAYGAEAPPPAPAPAPAAAPAQVSPPAPAAAPVPPAQAVPGKTAPAGQNGTPAPEVSLVEMVKALSQFLTEEEVQMVYDYLWDSSIAALKGTPNDITLPPELAFKLAILQKRIMKEGGRYLEGLALKMEQDLARWRESLAKPSAPVPYQLPSERAAPPQAPAKP